MTTQHPQEGPATGRRPLRRATPVLALGLVVMCGAFAGSASAAVPGLQLVTASSATNSVVSKSAYAICPVGKRLIGTGGEITGGLGQVVIDDLSPDTGLTNVRVLAREDQDGAAANWSVKAYAICANALPGLQLVTATSGTDSIFSKFVSANCPTGKRVTGTGAEITGGLGQVAISDLTPTDDPLPVSGLKKLRVGARETGSSALNWSVKAYAICANTLPGQELISGWSLSDSFSPKTVNTACPPGKRLIGAGALFAGGAGDIVLDDLTPNPGLTSVRGVAYEDQAGTTSNWMEAAHAICATA